MKKNILLFPLLVMSICAFSQTFTVVNKSGTDIFFTVNASDKNTCDQKYFSAGTRSVAGSTLTYNTPADIPWSGAAAPQGAEYSDLGAQFISESGACVSAASYHLGNSKCAKKSTATLDISKCGGSGSDLHLSWEEKNGNITVTIK